MRWLAVFAVIVLPMSAYAWTNIQPSYVNLSPDMVALLLASGKGRGHGGAPAGAGPAAPSPAGAVSIGEPARGEPSPSGPYAPFPPLMLVEPVPPPQPMPQPAVRGPSPQYLPEYATLSIPVRVAPQQVLQVMPGYQLGGWVLTDRGWVQTIQPQPRSNCP